MDRSRISSHPSFDDPHYWRFSRNSGLPIGYYDRPRLLTADVLVVVVCAVCFLVGMYFA